MLTCAILDDYQNCALGLADWKGLGVKVTTFLDHLDDPAALAERLADFEIVVAMRERTPFTAALFDKLPNLKLLVTTGLRNASIDMAAAAARGITVCGTRGLSNPTPELTWGLLLSLARHIGADTTSVRLGEPWQTRIGVTLGGKTIGIVGLG